MLEAQEAAAEERDWAQQELATDLNKRAVTIETAAKMLKQVIGALGSL